MIDICCEYDKEYDNKFNPTKTVCIRYGHVVMNGNTLEWADNVRHLGNLNSTELVWILDFKQILLLLTLLMSLGLTHWIVDTSVQWLLDM